MALTLDREYREICKKYLEISGNSDVISKELSKVSDEFHQGNLISEVMLFIAKLKRWVNLHFVKFTLPSLIMSKTGMAIDIIFAGYENYGMQITFKKGTGEFYGLIYVEGEIFDFSFEEMFCSKPVMKKILKLFVLIQAGKKLERKVGKFKEEIRRRQ